MNDSSFAAPDPAPPPQRRRHILANSGITLNRVDAGYLGVPNGMQRPDCAAHIQTFLLPMLPVSLIEYAAGWRRHIWRSHRRCACWLLYLDLGNHQWQVQFPPQYAGPEEFRADLSFSQFPAPADSWRLAGIFRSAAYNEHTDLRDELAQLDGLHLVMHPEFDWLQILAFMHLNQLLTPIDVEQVVAEDLRRFNSTDLSRRVRLIEPCD